MNTALKRQPQENIPEVAEVLPFPKRRRSGRPWNEHERNFAVANHRGMYCDQIGDAIGRSATAVEYFLAMMGLHVLRRPTDARRGRPASDGPGYVRNDDAAHLKAIFKARPQGFTW